MKNKYIAALTLGAILLIGIFLRVTHHEEWLHFESDQSRDALIVGKALELGPSALPLLGPQARGSELQLGPLFYYFQYPFGFIFGNEPHILVLSDLIFGILFLPLFYLLARHYFSVRISLLLTAIASTSLFLTTYSRFGWNPNALPFWCTLLSLSLLKLTADRHHIRWWTALIVSLCIVAQLHFVALFICTLVTIAFLVISKTHPSLRTSIFMTLITLILWSPVITHELRSEWQNTHAFIDTITDKTSQDDNHSILSKAIRATQVKTSHYWLLLSGDQQSGHTIKAKGDSLIPRLSCSDTCKEHLPSLLSGIVFALFSFVMIAKAWLQERRRVKPQHRHTLIILWLVFSSLMMIPIAYQLSPRFFLTLTPVFLIAFGYILSYYDNRLFLRIIPGFYIALSLTFILITSNLQAVYHEFSILQKSITSEVDPGRDAVMKRSDRITLTGLKNVAQWIDTHSTDDMIIVGDNRFARSIWYVIRRYTDAPVKCYIKRSDAEIGTLPTEYLLLTRTKSSSQLLADTKPEQVTAQAQFGSLTIYKVNSQNTQNTEVSPRCNTH